MQSGNSRSGFGAESHGIPRLNLARARDRLDAAARHSGHLADLAILHLDDGPGRHVSVEPAELGGRNLPVRGLRAVLIEDIEQDKAVWDGLLLGHGFALV